MENNSDYAKLKGRATVAPATAEVKPKTSEDLPPLTAEAHARIKQTIADVKEHLPEMVDMVKDFHAAGLIDGWRSVTFKRLDDEPA
ncbi:hypothetical protein EDC30_10986 [Paucimonas lemoignei]|uniref:Uncharacterized protein n=1 Tax=Paucimonas lemoignei TaxID=29443 RepID=A0A4R3HRN9_PAULE|nr:hypothetical protein [Paucimonas lemoignei]TCS35787.1 hypothetical protein EDC30_10986 [Paucimonas lemoignei]